MRSPQRKFLGHWAKAALGLAVLVSSALPESTTRPDDGDDSSPATIEALVHGTLDTEEGRRELELLLVEHGPEAIPVFLGELDGRCPLPPALSKQQLDCIHEGLVRRGRGALLGFLRARALAGTSKSSETQAQPAFDPVVTLRLLGDVGLATDLFLAIDAARSPSGPPPSRAVREALTSAVAKILERDPRGLHTLHDALLEAPPGIAAPLLSAIEKHPKREALVLCSDLLGFDRALDLLLISCAGRLSLALSPSTVMEFQEEFRSFLFTDDTQVLAEAILTAGRMDDFEVASHLAALLDSPDKSIRQNAAWALGHMTGIRLPRRSGDWQPWLARQQEWYEDRFPQIVRSLRTGDYSQISQGLAALAGRRFERHRMAEDVLFVLDDPEPRARIQCCRVLGQLDSALAIPALEHLVESDQPDVAQAASEALNQLRPAKDEVTH